MLKFLDVLYQPLATFIGESLYSVFRSIYIFYVFLLLTNLTLIFLLKINKKPDYKKVLYVCLIFFINIFMFVVPIQKGETIFTLKENGKKIANSIDSYKTKYNILPENLKAMSPEFLSNEDIESARRRIQYVKITKYDRPYLTEDTYGLTLRDNILGNEIFVYNKDKGVFESSK